MRSIFNQGVAAAAGWLLVLGVVAAPPAQAGVIRSDRPDALYRNLAAQPEFDPVGRFTWNESGGGLLASGSLIRGDWVLTAAHVVDGTDGFGAGINNLEFEVGGETYTAEEWIPHPNWALSGGETNLFAGWDIGLVRLDRSVDNVDPAQLFTGRDELGQEATIVGFGATGTGATGATQPAGTLRAGNNIVDVVGGAQSFGSDPRFRFGHDRLVAIDFDDPNNPFESTLGSRGALDLEYLTAPGDSGGGLFLEVDGEQLLAGVTSLGSSTDGDGANSDYGDRASFTRVSSFLDFIEAVIGPEPEPLAGDLNGDGVVDVADLVVGRDLDLDAEVLGAIGGQFGSSSLTSPVIAASVAVPEPVGLALAGLGLALLGWRRR